MKKLLITMVFCFPIIFIGSLSAQDNLAEGKTAYQSSNYGAGIANRAVDGNTNGAWTNNSITHTNLEKNPWWEVDLGQQCRIDEILIYNRTDCCPERLKTFSIMVKEAKNTYGQRFGGNKNYSDGKYTMRGDMKGRYVRIMLNEQNYLSLAEVVVKGEQLEFEDKPEPAPKPMVPLYIDVCTGNDGTDGDVYVSIHFTNGKKDKILLDKSNYDDFEKGDLDRYSTGWKVTDLNSVKGFSLSLESGDDWYVRGAKLVLGSNSKSCHSNIEKELESGTATFFIE